LNFYTNIKVKIGKIAEKILFVYIRLPQNILYYLQYEDYIQRSANALNTIDASLV